jgi:hypothetical protein
MKYLPFEDLEIHSKVSPDEVFHRLCASVDTEGKWLFFTNKPFWGEVYRGSFRFWRATWWNHNFTPIVSGIIQPDGSGCCLQVSMRMRWLSFLFYFAIFGFMWLSFFIGIANLILQKIQTGSWQIESSGEFLLNFLLYIIILGFIYLISVGAFKYDARYVKKYLIWLSEIDADSIVHYDKFLGIPESQIIKALFVVSFFVSFSWILFGLIRR